VGAELFYVDEESDGQTGIRKLIVAFRNFENAPYNCDIKGINNSRNLNSYCLPRELDVSVSLSAQHTFNLSSESVSFFVGVPLPD
jgi:hypothetical protein